MDKDTKIIQIPYLKEEPFLIHGFGTRYLTKEFLNNSFPYKKFLKLCLDQKHSDIIHCIEGESNEVQEGDGFITSVPNVLLVIKTADCLPVLLADTERKVVGAVHCGWRGSGKRILQKALKAMREKYLCSYSSLTAAMGPSICGKCYEVGAEVVDFFKGKNLPLHVFRKHPKNEKKYFLDLKKANQLQLQELGVGKDRIFWVDQCTYCSKHFLSYRRDGNGEGRMLNFIGISFDDVSEKIE
ncbi:MAG: peptidoglycan editing factor PgeF [Acidobacteriota bacterium]